jgi:hypothetical protein
MTAILIAAVNICLAIGAFGTKRSLLYKSILENMIGTICNISQYLCVSSKSLFVRVT